MYRHTHISFNHIYITSLIFHLTKVYKNIVHLFIYIHPRLPLLFFLYSLKSTKFFIHFYLQRFTKNINFMMDFLFGLSFIVVVAFFLQWVHCVYISDGNIYQKLYKILDVHIPIRNLLKTRGGIEGGI